MKHMAIMGLMLAFTLPAAPAETETRQERQARELEISLRHALLEWSNIAALGRIFYRDEDDEIIAYPAVTRQEWERKYEQARRQRQEEAERARQAQQERERERQARDDAERERKERTDALPPKARLAAELCHDADAVMKMAVWASREKLISGHDEILHVIKTDRRYLPAAPEETALKLSRLARNLRKEAKLWGFPCEP